MTQKDTPFKLSARQNKFYNAADLAKDAAYQIPQDLKTFLTDFDVAYRALCSVLYNFAPLSGHPGGSISSGRIVSTLMFNTMAYNFAAPDDNSNDIYSYAAGHKALGLYAMSALRDEVARLLAPQMLAAEGRRLRMEDLLGFRKNKTAGTKLFKQFNSKSLDGHPVPLTPFIKLATGASGVGFASSVGLALAAADIYGQNAPRVNIIEGEGGLTAGRCSEALAIATTAGLDNLTVHLDWNQASIESDKVTAENGTIGDYVAWEPAELFYINGLNVITVPDGFNLEQIYAAQKFAANLNNGRPTAIVYRTVKGWKYGLEGRASHGSGHKFESDGYVNTLAEFETTFNCQLPHTCQDGKTPDGVEHCFWETLLAMRKAIEANKQRFAPGAEALQKAAQNLIALGRKPSPIATEGIYKTQPTPDNFKFKAGDSPTVRSVMADALALINKEAGGAVLVSSADLGGSTGASAIAKDFGKGFYNKQNNPQSRLIAGGGICEDGMSGVLSGVAAFGGRAGVAASYAAFTSPMMHTAARLHAIGAQALEEATGKKADTFIVFSGHAGMPTGEDGPTHADPQALQLVLDNFPKGRAITLTPLDAADVWPLLTEALSKRPSVLYPFVTRPNVKVAPRPGAAQNAAKGVYLLNKSAKKLADGVIIVQGSGAGEIFANEVLPQLKEQNIDVNAYYVSSAELFNMLPAEERQTILPCEDLCRAIAITDFTLPTMQCWLKSADGAQYSIYPFKHGNFMGSGKAPDVYKEAKMDADGQMEQIKEYLAALKNWH